MARRVNVGGSFRSSSVKPSSAAGIIRIAAAGIPAVTIYQMKQNVAFLMTSILIEEGIGGSCGAIGW